MHVISHIAIRISFITLEICNILLLKCLIYNDVFAIRLRTYLGNGAVLAGQFGMVGCVMRGGGCMMRGGGCMMRGGGQGGRRPDEQNLNK